MMKRVLTGELTSMTLQDKNYNFRVERLNENGYDQGCIIWAFDTTEQVKAMEEVQDRAIRDTLTGLYNRTHFQHMIQSYLQKRGSGCFFMVDMDNFKQVNDNFGHQAGDEVLTAFAAVLKEYPQEKCLSARLGGDEFVAFYKGETNEEKLGEEMTGLMNRFEEKLSQKGLAGVTGITIGGVICGHNMVSPREFDAIYKLADDRLYEAKTAGKHCYRLMVAE